MATAIAFIIFAGDLAFRYSIEATLQLDNTERSAAVWHIPACLPRRLYLIDDAEFIVFPGILRVSLSSREQPS